MRGASAQEAALGLIGSRRMAQEQPKPLRISSHAEPELR